MPESYQVYHDVPHIRQPQSNACWYTCLSMLIQYWRNWGGRGELVDPGDNTLAVSLLTANNGINWSQASHLVRHLHFKLLPASDSVKAVYEQLQKGPFIFAGMGAGGSQGHWVVFRGMCQNILWINDPRRDAPTQEDCLSFMNQAPPWNRAWIY